MTASHAHHAPHGRRSSGRILVIDADPISLVALAGVLDAEHFECLCARSLDAAGKAVEAHSLDLVVCDVGQDPAAVLAWLERIRNHQAGTSLGAVLIADSRWSGLERKTERLAATHCLFKPIDPTSLLPVVEQAIWMPHLIDTHRRRGTRPSRPGWLKLD